MMHFSSACLLALPLSASALPVIAVKTAVATTQSVISSFADVSKQLAALTDATEAFKGGRSGLAAWVQIKADTIGALDTMSFLTYQVTEGDNIGIFEASSYSAPITTLVTQIKAWDDSVQEKARALRKSGDLPTTYALVDRLYTETKALSDALESKMPFGFGYTYSALKSSSLDSISDTRTFVRGLLPAGSQVDSTLAYGPGSNGPQQPAEVVYQQPAYQQPATQPRPTYQQPATQPRPTSQQPKQSRPKQQQSSRPAQAQPNRAQPAAAQPYQSQPYQTRPESQPYQNQIQPYQGQPFQSDSDQSQYQPVAVPYQNFEPQSYTDSQGSPTAKASAAKPAATGIFSGLFASIGL